MVQRLVVLTVLVHVVSAEGRCIKTFISCIQPFIVSMSLSYLEGCQCYCNLPKGRQTLWESVIVLYFVARYFMSILVLQSSWWGRESWLLCLICLPGVSWWLSSSSSRCHGVVCGLWLWYFLIILTYYFVVLTLFVLVASAEGRCNYSILSKPLSVVYSHTLFQCHCPTWKDANVIAIFRKADKPLPSNYRPISPFSQPEKVMQRCIDKHLNKYTPENNLLIILFKVTTHFNCM